MFNFSDLIPRWLTHQAGFSARAGAWGATHDYQLFRRYRGWRRYCHGQPLAAAQTDGFFRALPRHRRRRFFDEAGRPVRNQVGELVIRAP